MKKELKEEDVEMEDEERRDDDPSSLPEDGEEADVLDIRYKFESHGSIGFAVLLPPFSKEAIEHEGAVFEGEGTDMGVRPGALSACCQLALK